jgi:hypothetical protein
LIFKILKKFSFIYDRPYRSTVSKSTSDLGDSNEQISVIRCSEFNRTHRPRRSPIAPPETAGAIVEVFKNGQAYLVELFGGWVIAIFFKSVSRDGFRI